MEDNSFDEIEERALYSAYFGKNDFYYLKCLDNVKQGIIIDINIYAFIANIFWFLYRKMFLEATVILLIYIGIFFLYSQFSSYFILLYFPVLFALALIGNYLYINKAIRIIEKAKRYDNYINRFEYLRKKGGTNVSFFISAFVSFTVLFLIIFILIIILF